MTTIKKVLFFFVLPFIATLLYQPSTLSKAFNVIAVVAVFFVIIGALLLRGSSRALTFMIFLNGMNVVVRMMMLLSTSNTEAGGFNPSYTIFSLAGLALSFYLMLRLDKVDVRQHMTRT